MYKRMLVLLDGSKIAYVVFSYARELAGRLGLDLDLLYVCTPEQAQQLPMLQGYIESVAARLKARSESIRNKPGIKSGKKVIDARGKVVIGYPAEEILKYAEDNKIDLIMLATHDRSGFSRFVFGSVTGNMLRRLQKTPMFLVRPSH